MPKIAAHHLIVRSREQLNGFLLINKKSIQCLKSDAVLTKRNSVTNKRIKKIKQINHILCMVKKKLKWKKKKKTERIFLKEQFLLHESEK